MNKYAVYATLDNDKTLCRIWVAELSAWVAAVFFNRSDASFFVEQMEGIKGNEGFNYTVEIVENI